jgi:hypothetical protein
MRNYLILLLCSLIFSCQKEIMLSEALPIEFWPIEGQTFNEKVNAYVDSQCFTQEFKCSDNVKLQLVQHPLDYSKPVVLKSIDKNGALIQSTNFIKTIFESGSPIKIDNKDITSNPIGTSFFNFDGSNRSTALPFDFNSPKGLIINYLAGTNTQASKYLAIKRTDVNASLGWPPGTYSIRIKASNSSTLNAGNGDPIIFSFFGMDNSSVQTSLGSVSTPSTLPFSGFTQSFIDVTFTTTIYWQYLALSITRAGGGGTFILRSNIDSIEITSVNKDLYSSNDLTFTASSLAIPICDDSVKFVISVDGIDKFKSDYIKFSSLIAYNQGYGTLLIAYKSQNNFAGINYPNDGGYFYLRIPCRFFEQRNNRKQSSLELSNSKVINTSVIMKLQQLITTTLLPDYMHNKIELAIAHAVRGSLLIDGYEWSVEETYERNKQHQKSPMQMAKVWLTRKNHLVRNII